MQNILAHIFIRTLKQYGLQQLLCEEEVWFAWGLVFWISLTYSLLNLSLSSSCVQGRVPHLLCDCPAIVSITTLIAKILYHVLCGRKATVGQGSQQTS